MEINESKFIGTSKISIAITMNAEDWETIQKSKSWENIVNFVEEAESIRAMRKVDKEFYGEEAAGMERIDRLYTLLERNDIDEDTKAALRWAIFQLEDAT